MTSPGPADEFRRDDTDGVITITFTRDRKLNAVTGAMLDGIREAVADLRDRDENRVLVITAEGRYFTAGADITALPVGETGPDVPGSTFRRNYRRLHELFDEIEAVEKPVIIVAQGPCLGIGMELSSSCDFRFAAEGARFGLPEVRNIAAMPGSGGISRLTRLIGPHWVRWLAMAGQEIDAAQALNVGYLHAVYPADELQARVGDFVRDLLSQPAEALGLAKIVIDAAATSDRTAARDFDRVANTALVASVEHRAKLDAFAARGKK
ncbi:MAG TPA: enoyl-CoA hydratase/isomerase family protein [Pseudonocardia sp.]|jgi:enoyl-CoA hydratase/carnithine racemase|nr:enoyl-CoA hydratase/isomerase family protein [Pseudonocardia sp.]